MSARVLCVVLRGLSTVSPLTCARCRQALDRSRSRSRSISATAASIRPAGEVKLSRPSWRSVTWTCSSPSRRIVARMSTVLRPSRSSFLATRTSFLRSLSCILLNSAPLGRVHGPADGVGVPVVKLEAGLLDVLDTCEFAIRAAKWFRR